MKTIPAWILILALLATCRPGSREAPEVRVDEAFKSMFFSDSSGITGADGIFSVALNRQETVFFLGDCFLGKVEDNTRDINTTMMRNAFILLDAETGQKKAIYRGEYDQPVTLMSPVNEEGDSTYRWYWPGHGFRKGSILYVFALNLYNEPAAVVKSDRDEDEMDQADQLEETMLAFRISHIDLLSFSLLDFKHLETWKAGFDYREHPIDFGNCIMVDEEYVYIYGTKNDPGMSRVHVARIPFDSEEFHRGWEYHSGDGWSKEIGRSVPIEVDLSVSEQFSIFRCKDQYVLLTQERAGTDIFTYTSSFPHKDFGNKQFIYHTPDHEMDPNRRIHAYNALAHPQFIENNELLVSYCVNSISVRDVFENVDSYRARFIRVPMSMILDDK
jgi:hypothetical protein